MDKKKITSNIIHYITILAEVVFKKSLFMDTFWLRFYSLFYPYMFLVA
tara:strand:+ start:2017 stop:2160 length:144 start_codon:yes stop_codon:yes gene_type:complete